MKILQLLKTHAVALSEGHTKRDALALQQGLLDQGWDDVKIAIDDTDVLVTATRNGPATSTKPVPHRDQRKIEIEGEGGYRLARDDQREGVSWLSHNAPEGVWCGGDPSYMMSTEDILDEMEELYGTTTASASLHRP